MISDRYYRDVGMKPLLTKEQEAELGVRSLGGDIEARNALVEANLRLVLSLVKKHRKRQDFDDIISAGNAGLIRAAQKFDPSKGFRFTTYATWWIRQQVREYFADTREIGKYAYAHATRAALHAEQIGVKPSSLSVDEICNLFNTTQARATTIKAAVNNMNRESKDLPRENVSTEERPGVQVERNEMLEEVLKAFGDLDERKQTVIRMRLGIGTEPSTLKQVGNLLGICRERVRQLESKAIDAMRKSLRED